MGRVYLFYGDPLLVEEAISQLRKELLPQPSPMNEFVFDGEASGKEPGEQIREISAALQTSPLFGGASWLLVKRAWVGGGRKGKTPESEEEPSQEDDSEESGPKESLFTSLKPLADTIEERKGEFGNNLILVGPPHASPAKTNPLVKAIQKYGVIIDKAGFSPYRPEEALQWVSQQGYPIDPQASRILIERLGMDTLLLKNGLEKLHLYSGGGKIQVSHVEALIPEEEDEATLIYEAMNRKENLRALEIIKGILNQPKSHPLQVLAMLTTLYRRALLVKLLQREHGSAEKVVQQLKIMEEKQRPEERIFKRTPSQPRDLYLYLQKCPFSVESLTSLLGALLRADRQLKSSTPPEEAFLFLFQHSAALR